MSMPGSASGAHPASSNIGSTAVPGRQRPFSEATAHAAADWLTLLMSGDAGEADTRRWQQWRAADPEHERAWLHLESVTGRFKALDAAVAYRTLSPLPGTAAPRSPRRRGALAVLALVGGAGAAGVLASRSTGFQALAADHRTGTGERLALVLQDGTRVTLNTASAIDLRFDSQQRVLRLVAGEIEVTTGHLAAGGGDLPFFVETAEGRVRALGTRFTVRQDPGRSQVVVLDSAVEITPAAGGAVRRLKAGEQVAFDRQSVGEPRAADDAATAWLRRQIVADDVRLEDFLAELGRYRPGLLRCDPAVAGLRLSGVFPLDDTDRILAALPSVLPVQVTQRTRYWVTVGRPG